MQHSSSPFCPFEKTKRSIDKNIGVAANPDPPRNPLGSVLENGIVRLQTRRRKKGGGNQSTNQPTYNNSNSKQPPYKQASSRISKAWKKKKIYFEWGNTAERGYSQESRRSGRNRIDLSRKSSAAGNRQKHRNIFKVMAGNQLVSGRREKKTNEPDAMKTPPTPLNAILKGFRTRE
ncbi:hypothetical protein M434DRAFT_231024 [Hypoxylon sp. CO27-5]|nr:hypothetical protein M434DRAFT_231024 [Hypoxylon sp. CO27-5]